MGEVTVNDAVAFLVEVAVLILLAVWGFQIGSGPMSWVLGVGIPGAAIAIWALFAAPNSVYDILVAEIAVKALVLGGGLLAAFVLLPVGWAIAFAAVVAVNTILLYVGPFAR